ncbi:MAG: hypothetical protein LBF05_01295, partial [Tannerella sp.]|nr:hypothetical protein [Tannerella sp.]
MVSTIRVLFLAVIVLFSLCCCGKKGVDVSLDAIMPDTTILSDPYRTFTPDIYESIEHNDKYREWFFNGAFQNVNVEKLKFFKQKDTLVYIGSGIRGMNTLVNVSTRQILPKEGKSMELRLIYEYAPYPPEATMTLRTRFFTHNT